MVDGRPDTIPPELPVDLVDHVDGAEIRWVLGEQVDIPASPPDRWLAGRHLRGVVTTHRGQRGTPAPHALDPESVVVRRDGRRLDRGVDFQLDGVWGSVGSAARPGLAEVDYRYSLRRIDTIAVDESGRRHVLRGISHLTAPMPPELPPGWTVLANAYVPYFAPAGVFELYPIEENEGSAATPHCVGPARARGALAAGRPLRITFWGDSVTVGGDASSAATTFPEGVRARLSRQFPAATISVNVVAVSGSTTRDWLRSERAGCDWSLVEATRPDLVVAEFINDAGLPDSEWEALYGEVGERVTRLGAELLLTTPHWSMAEWMPELADTGEDRRPYVAFLHRLASEQGLPLADVSAQWTRLRSRGLPFETLLNNGINHPDDRGHDLAAEVIARCIGGEPPDPKDVEK